MTARYWLLFSLVLLVSACTVTQVEESWTLPGYKPPSQKKVLVIAMASDETTREAVENEFVAQLEALGHTAMASSDAIPDSTIINRESVEPIVRKHNITLVLVSSLRGIEKNTVYQPPDHIGPTDNLYRNFDTYYAYSNTGQHEAGTYSQLLEYLVETNLYDVANQKLSWSVNTRTAEPSSLEKGTESVVSAILERARKDKVL